jgi:hypothetical protein
MCDVRRNLSHGMWFLTLFSFELQYMFTSSILSDVKWFACRATLVLNAQILIC